MGYISLVPHFQNDATVVGCLSLATLVHLQIRGNQLHGLFPSSYGKEYVHMVVDYISNCIEAITLPTNQSKHVLGFLCRNIFARLECLCAIISDGGSYFYNKLFMNLMTMYRVTHKVAMAYDP